MAASIEQNLGKVRERIECAATLTGRKLDDITLVAVSKKQPISKINSAVSAGQLVFGENYVQEAVSKIEYFHKPECEKNVRFHFIGQLQSNKVKDVVGVFDVIETVHKIKLADKLNKEALKKGLIQEVFVQVNISEEETKSGTSPTEAVGVCRHILSLNSLRLGGLMAIGSMGSLEESKEVRGRDFVKLANLREVIQDELGAVLPHLSMGTSSDFDLAIECGATVVRVGTDIFGSRLG